MPKTTVIYAGIALLSLFLGSCSAATESPVIPPGDSQQVAASQESPDSGLRNRYLWGFYEISIDMNAGIYEVTPVRQASGHWNVLKFLEQAPCTDCVKVTDIIITPEYTKKIDVEIRHPFDNANLTGFDVRGIAMFGGSYVFPLAGLVMSNRNAGEGELVNADGYTSLYNPTTAGSGPGGLQGYAEGEFASATAPNTTLNGYKRYISPGASNTRNAFYAGATLVKSFDIDMPWYEFVFGYAIDAGWAPPTEKPVEDPMTDFPPEANCAEPWQVNVAVAPVGAGLTEQGGEAKLTIDVYDRQGYISHQAPIVECPSLFDGVKVADFVQDYGDYSTWEVTVGNEKLAGSGDYRTLIKVVDNEDLSAPAWLDLTAYQVTYLTVGEVGWSRTWGGTSNDKSHRVAVDYWGRAFVVGNFRSSVDFDPGPGSDFHTATGGDDAFLCKFDSSGDFEWARTWGGPDNEDVGSIWLGNNESIYLTGPFRGTCDFDPGPGDDSHTAVGDYDAYMTRFDSDGNHQWTVTWGGPGRDVGTGVGVGIDPDVYVTGRFTQTVDFDPGTGVTTRTSQGGDDVFLSRFNNEGEFQSVITWGGDGDDGACGIDFDFYHSPCVAGYFSDAVDFDPGVNEELRTSNGLTDVFLALYSTTLDYMWVCAWGGTGYDQAMAMKYDPWFAAFFVTGYFSDVVDFNPGSNVDSHTSAGDVDAFVSCFWADDFLWARTWGGPEADTCTGVAAQPYGFDSLVVSGSFNGTVDFDPGGGLFNRDSHGGADCYISVFTEGGIFSWARTWGAIDNDYGEDVAVRQQTGSIYTVGSFSGTVDMDPGPYLDNHTSNGWSDAFLSKFMPDGSW